MQHLISESKQQRQGLYSKQSGNHKAALRINWQATLVHSDNHPKLSTAIYHRQSKAETILNIIALDTSGSTLASEQLSDAKAVVLSLCEYFYQQRQRITLLCFGNQRTDWVVSDSKVPFSLDKILSSIQAGGGTPLRLALLEIRHYIAKRGQEKPAEKQKLFIISDGRSRDKLDDIRLDNEVEIWVLDSEKSAIKLNKARDLAIHLGADYMPLFTQE
ncbi:MAG: VWA domain-containing protein [Cocleimonas sp.]|nr:VWA domain-containing protein [Cocleimonas sp.]